MQSTLPLTLGLLLAATLFNACGKVDEVKAAGEASIQAISELSREDLSKLAGDLGTQLASIKDAATAENVSKVLEPALKTLRKAKALAGERINLHELVAASKKLKERFAGNEQVLKTLKPLLDQLSALND